MEGGRPVVLVTGGSRGIGAATARAAAHAGYDVAITYASQQAAAERTVLACEAAGGAALAVRADVADEGQVLAAFAAVDARFGRLDALVNNAGVLDRQSRVEDLDAGRIRRILEVNVLGALVCCREAVRRLPAGGAIVNVSSRAAVLGGPGEYVDYAASKAALDAVTVGLSKEVAGAGIRVNGVRPGLIETDIHASGGEAGRVARLAPSVPLGRGGTSEEVAAVILWLLSDAASYVTGTHVDVSGGR